MTQLSAASPTAPLPPVPAPSTRALFFGFMKIGLSGFGGVLPIARHALVQRNRWLDDREFAELLSLGQALPGPNIFNMALMMGYRFRGIRGALACVIGMTLAPMIVVLALASVYAQFADVPLVQKMITGIAAAAAGLVMTTGIRMVLSQPRRVAVWGLVAGTVVAKIVLGVPLLLVLLVVTLAGLAMIARGMF